LQPLIENVVGGAVASRTRRDRELSRYVLTRETKSDVLFVSDHDQLAPPWFGTRLDRGGNKYLVRGLLGFDC
jgi:hypothetical protein